MSDRRTRHFAFADAPAHFKIRRKKGVELKEDFSQIIEAHFGRYPAMQPQDFGKLIFQSEFGAEHMLTDQKAAGGWLREEWRRLPDESAPAQAEAIGGGMCRFPISACKNESEVNVLAELFALTAKKRRGSLRAIPGKVECVMKQEVHGMHAWMLDWKARGYPPVHHSDVYRNAYQPHYRLLQWAYAGAFPALAAISALLERKKPVRVGIDGRCGSGKTHFAQLIATLFPCNVIHMDDFYLPLSLRKEGWMEQPGGNMDFARLKTEILEPADKGEAMRYRPYSCQTGEMAEAYAMPFRLLTVVEGSYSHHPLLHAQYDLKIFLTCSKEEQTARIKKREGSYFTVFENQWMPLEECYLARYSIAADSALCIDTSAFF